LTAAAKSKRIPPGLAKVRKELPPPGKIFKSKKRESRKQAREKILEELKESRRPKSF
jgi:hypothetical protein